MLVEVCMFVLGLLGWYLWTHRRTLRLALSLPPVPGYPAYPLIGHMHYIMRGFTGVSNTLAEAMKTVPTTIEPREFVVWLGMYPIITFFGSEDVQIILNSRSTIDKGPELSIVKYAFGNGLLTASGKYWKALRRHMNPLFHSRNLSHLVPSVNTCARELAMNLYKHSRTGQVNVQHYVFDAHLASTLNLLFGPDFKVNVHSESFKRIKTSLESISFLFAIRLFKFWLWPEFIFKMLYYNVLRDIDDSFKTYLQGPLKEFEPGILPQNDLIPDDKSSSSRFKRGIDKKLQQTLLADVYTKLHQQIADLSKQTLQEDIATLMLTGSDTVTTSTSSCLLALSVYPDIQERLYEEIVNVVGNEETEISLGSLNKMLYLDQVVKETMRWTLIVPLITRRVTKDIKLSKFTVPAGSTVGMCLTAIHYDPRYYPNPKRFNPDNFLPERVAARPKYSFVAFSGGPRVCIGKNFAIIMMKIFLVHVLRKYKVSSDVDIDSLNNVLGLVFTFKEGYKIQFEVR